MFAKVVANVRGGGLRASALRGMTWTVVGYGGSQFLRLLSNLILTRLFLPDIFGIMALVQVFMQGLAMLSDTGMQAAIIQSERGDESKFLNTAWTIGVLRGFALWAAACALGYPAALLYSAPELAFLIPAVGVTVAIGGFQPTKVVTANRHLNLGRLTIIDLTSQAMGIVTIMLLAIWIRSAWAMALGGIASAVVHLVLAQRLLPGITNRFEWCSASSIELFRFGRWIFLGSIAGFLIGQGDRMVLGLYTTLDQLGIYNIGWFLGSVPLALSVAVSHRVMLPVYGKQDPGKSKSAYANILRTRSLLSGLFVSLALTAAYVGPFFVDLMYSNTYTSAGVIATLISLACIPKVVFVTNEPALLARGDSKSFTLLLVASGVVQIGAFAVLVPQWGVCGIVLALAVTPIVIYPFMARLLRVHGAWMPGHDLVFAGCGAALGAGAIWFHRQRVSDLLVECGVGQW